MAPRGEAYDAYEALYRWIMDEKAPSNLAFMHYDIDTVRGWMRTATAGIDPRGSNHPRAELLKRIWHEFNRFNWRSLLRFQILECIAMALSKYFGELGNHQRALFFVDGALAEPRLSFHLRAARHALRLVAEGAPVPPRLAKFIGPDNGYLKKFVCSMPFKRFDIVETGEINVCCGHWLSRSIGKIDEGELNDILNSEKVQAVRRSMLDGTYKYCNHLDCVALAQDTVTPRERVTDPVVREAITTGDCTVEHVDDMLFAYDQSCNLACPSCRRERIIEKPSENEAKGAARWRQS